jgi:hypothetical protein
MNTYGRGATSRKRRLRNEDVHTLSPTGVGSLTMPVLVKINFDAGYKIKNTISLVTIAERLIRCKPASLPDDSGVLRWVLNHLALRGTNRK